MVAYRQTYEIIRGIQEKAAEQCAPVIFGIKPSNLLIIDQCYAKALKSLVETTGLKVRCFEHRAKKQVWFLFRKRPFTVSWWIRITGLLCNNLGILKI